MVTEMLRMLVAHMDPDASIHLIEDIPELPSMDALTLRPHRARRAAARAERGTARGRNGKPPVIAGDPRILGEFRARDVAAFIDLTQQGVAGLTTAHGLTTEHSD